MIYFRKKGSFFFGGGSNFPVAAEFWLSISVIIGLFLDFPDRVCNN